MRWCDLSDDPKKRAVEFLIRDFSCAQSVFAAIAPRMGMDEDTALKTAACFGAGMARQGQTCGAVTGALMVLGLAYGATDSERSSKELAYGKAQEFIRNFKGKRGTTVCRELVGFDLSDDEQLKAARDSGAFIKICVPIVQEAVGMLEATLPESKRDFTTENTEDTEKRPEEIFREDEINQLTERVIGAAIEVHKELGPGLLESAYEECLCLELSKAGIAFQRQLALPINFHGVKLDCGYRLDLLVGGMVVVEIKSVKAIEPIHEAQLITYLKLGTWPVGLLLNFNVRMLKQGIVRKRNFRQSEPNR